LKHVEHRLLVQLHHCVDVAIANCVVGFRHPYTKGIRETISSTDESL